MLEGRGRRLTSSGCCRVDDVTKILNFVDEEPTRFELKCDAGLFKAC